MRPHILSPKLLINTDIRDIQQELTVGLYSAAFGRKTLPFQWTSSGIRISKKKIHQFKTSLHNFDYYLRSYIFFTKLYKHFFVTPTYNGKALQMTCS
jgi:hypothetical protein